ncbi:MAG: hypothetical protein WBZ04_07315 [Candidatus Nanopelagicales bacterium]
MTSWWPIVMLGLTGFFIGGVIAFTRAKIPVLAIGMGIAAVLSGAAAWAWWQ